MSLLDKFFGNGEIRNRNGEYAGRIEHASENVAHLYDEYGRYNGRVQAYGDEVTVFDKNGAIIESGTNYGSSDTLKMYSYTDSSSKRYRDVGETSISNYSDGYEFGSIYRSNDVQETDGFVYTDSFW